MSKGAVIVPLLTQCLYKFTNAIVYIPAYSVENAHYDVAIDMCGLGRSLLAHNCGWIVPIALICILLRVQIDIL